MGVPRWYYTRILQNFAHCLAISVDNDWKLAKVIYEETNDKKLEQFILERKEKLTNNDFYFFGGRAAQVVVDESIDEGSDGMTACCGGLNDFCEFLGVDLDEEGD